jgi:hypothetical protein
MKQVRDKLIKEDILLSKCKKGDEVRIGSFTGPKPFRSVGDVILEKVKIIPSGRIQIKFRKRNWTGSTIQKLEVPVTFVVERTRKWVASDGEGTGFYQPDVVRILGIDHSVEPDSTAAVLIKDGKVQAIMPNPMFLDHDSVIPPGGMLGAILANVAARVKDPTTPSMFAGPEIIDGFLEAIDSHKGDPNRIVLDSFVDVSMIGSGIGRLNPPSSSGGGMKTVTDSTKKLLK